MDLPRYVSRDSFQTVLDEKSGYDHILLTNDSRTFFGIQWADGTSHITHYPLDGRSLLLFITAQAWLQPIYFGH